MSVRQARPRLDVVARRPAGSGGGARPIVGSVVVLLAIFAALAAAVAGQGPLGVDRTILRLLGHVYTHSPTSALEVLLVVSMVLGAVVTAAVVAWLWVRGRRWDAAFVGLSMVGILILDLALEQVIARRPLGDPRAATPTPVVTRWPRSHS